MSVRFAPAERLSKLPPYLFVEIDKAKKEARKKGVDVIDFGVGDPDLPTPDFIIRALFKALKDSSTHHYPLDSGNSLFKEAISAWYRERFGVKLDASSEVLPLIGSKEGIAHIPLAFVNPGDVTLVPDPGYPAYRTGITFAGGKVVELPLRIENHFLPDFSEMRKETLRQTKLMFLNYPNNPTSATASKSFFKEVIKLANHYGILVCHDAAYSEIFFGNERPVSFLELPGAKEAGIEFHSLSKTCNMTGWRVGFACGNREVIQKLAKVKSNIDSGLFTAIQMAGIEALRQSKKFSAKMSRLYEERRDLLIGGLKMLNLSPYPAKATFYVWVKLPRSLGDSTHFCQRILEEAGIVVTPGVGFGKQGEGYFRFALTVPRERIKEALRRLGKVL